MASTSSQHGEDGGPSVEAQWDLDTDEIRSVDSDELYEARPNRWRGPKSSWRTLTEDDRLTYTALVGLRDRDLSLHLYNVFALKRQTREGRGEEDGYDGSGTDGWAPPKRWTAWPMRADFVPDEDLLGRDRYGIGDESVTLPSSSSFQALPRPRKQDLPSTDLEEEISATVLKVAKERFRKRKRKFSAIAEASKRGCPLSPHSASTPPSGNDESDAVHTEPAEAGEGGEDDGHSDDDGAQESSDADDTNADSPGRNQNRRKQRRDAQGEAAHAYIPVVSADDELSYRLVRPAAREILHRLDKTLTILHNARMAGASYLDDSSASEFGAESDTDGGTMSRTGRSTSRRSWGSRSGRSRSQSLASAAWSERSPDRGSDTAAGDGRGGEQAAEKRTRRGRPRKALVPREGETEEEMLNRVAKERKKRLPFPELRTESEARGRSRTPGSAASTTRRPASVKSDGKEQQRSHAATIRNKEEALSRWALRDWSDVIGAAALAGFSERVISRAAQRCADLFGQGMDIHTLLEVPVGRRRQRSDTAGRKLTRHQPAPGGGGTASRFTIDDDDSFLERTSEDEASADRDTASTAAVATLTPLDPAEDGTYLCPHKTCARATKGFARHRNLVRHLTLVHKCEDYSGRHRLPGRSPKDGGDDDDVPAANDARRETYQGARGEEEGILSPSYVGAVHEDGFLQPVRIQRVGRGAEGARSRSASVGVGVRRDPTQ